MEGGEFIEVKRCQILQKLEGLVRPLQFILTDVASLQNVEQGTVLIRFVSQI